MVGQAEDPRADRGEGRHAEDELDAAVVVAGDDLVLSDLVGDAAGFERVDEDAHLDGSAASVSHGSSGSAASMSTAPSPSGTTPSALPASPLVTSPSMRSTRNVRTALLSRSHATRYQWPNRNHRPSGATRRSRPVRYENAAVAFVRTASNRSISAGVGTIDAIGTDVAEAGRAQLQQRIPPTRIAQVDAGDGEVQRDLLVRLECEVGQVELVAVDPVPVLLVARAGAR